MRPQRAIFLNAACFVAGFSLVFAAVGVLLQTLLSGVAYQAVNALRIAGGTIIILFGVFLIASLKYRIPFLSSEHAVRAKRFRNSYVTSLVFGVAFAVSWTPCVGAILGSVYALAATSPGIAFVLLLAYALGIGVPFLLAGAFADRFGAAFKRLGGALRYVTLVSGLFLVALGLLVAFGYIGIISGMLGGPQDLVSGQLSLFVAFAAGLLTFLSPCILPLVPAYLAYMAGTSARSEMRRKR